MMQGTCTNKMGEILECSSQKAFLLLKKILYISYIYKSGIIFVHKNNSWDSMCDNNRKEEK